MRKHKCMTKRRKRVRSWMGWKLFPEKNQNNAPMSRCQDLSAPSSARLWLIQSMLVSMQTPYLE